MNSYDLDSVHANAIDTQHLARLRGAVSGQGGDSRAAIRETAEQFEAVFVQSMLKQMRATIPDGGMFDSPGRQQYQSLFDQQMAADVARGQGMGLADMVERQILESRGLEPEAPGELDRSLDAYANRMPARETGPMPGIRPTEEGTRNEASHPQAQPSPGREAEAAPETRDTGTFQDPQSFLETLRPLAERTGRELGVPPRALLAQAALETGWGQHVLRHGDGNSSHNVFNIKAHRGWEGDAVSVPTLEYRDGVAVRERAEFRSYDSLEQAFADYADFLRGHPRYAEALQAGDDGPRFARALQSAGYATDPAYADKLEDIMRGLARDEPARVAAR